MLIMSILKKDDSALINEFTDTSDNVFCYLEHFSQVNGIII